MNRDAWTEGRTGFCSLYTDEMYLCIWRGEIARGKAEQAVDVPVTCSEREILKEQQQQLQTTKQQQQHQQQ